MTQNIAVRGRHESQLLKISLHILSILQLREENTYFYLYFNALGFTGVSL